MAQLDLPPLDQHRPSGPLAGLLGAGRPAAPPEKADAGRGLPLTAGVVLLGLLAAGIALWAAIFALVRPFLGL